MKQTSDFSAQRLIMWIGFSSFHFHKISIWLSLSKVNWLNWKFRFWQLPGQPKIKKIIKSRLLPLPWHHNGHDGVWNHQPHDCLLNRLFRRRSKKTSKLRVTGLCAGNSPGPVNSPHKWPVMRKICPFDDIIMALHFMNHELHQLSGKSDWLHTDTVTHTSAADVTLTYKSTSDIVKDCVNSSPPPQNGRHFTDDIFRCIFAKEKFCILIKIPLKFASKGAIGWPDNGLKL